MLRERAKVKYVPDEALATLLPVRVAIVEIVLKTARGSSERVEAVRGTVRNPMTREEVVAKARDLIAPVLGASQTQKLIDATLASMSSERTQAAAVAAEGSIDREALRGSSDSRTPIGQLLYTGH